MRPYRIGRTAGGLAATGIEDKDIVYISVAVTVVFREIDRSVQLLACLDRHFLRIFIIAAIVVAAIVTHVLRQRDRSIDIKLRTELIHRAFPEIFSRTTRAVIIIEARFVEHAVEIAVRIAQIKFDILIFYKDNQSFLLSHRRKAGVKQAHIAATRRT